MLRTIGTPGRAWKAKDLFCVTYDRDRRHVLDIALPSLGCDFLFDYDFRMGICLISTSKKCCAAQSKARKWYQKEQVIRSRRIGQ